MVAVAFSPDGEVLAAGAANDNKIRFWQVKNGQALGTLIGHNGTVAELAFSPDGKRLASSSYDQTIGLWDLQTLRHGHSLRPAPITHRTGRGPCLVCCLSPDSKLLVSGSKDQTVRLWDTASGGYRRARSSRPYGGD